MIGFGTIGKGVSKLVKSGKDFSIVAVSDRSGSAYCKNGLDVDALLMVKNYKGSVKYYPNSGNLEPLELLESNLDDIDIVVEATPTNLEDGQPSISYIERALKCGKHVVTSNKGPLTLKYEELISLATRYKVKLKYGACVGGAVPVIRLCEYVKSAKVTSVRGILNGTTNYILDSMYYDGLSLDGALKEAKENGMAESNPSLDINGDDSAAKLTIMGKTLGKKIDYNSLKKMGKIKGISDISVKDVEKAKSEGKIPKLIAGLNNKEGYVHMKMVPRESNLAGVHKNYNGVEFETELIGNLFVKGYGSGERTAFAVLEDIKSIKN